MDQTPGLSTPPARTDTRLGLIIRLAFFVASVIIGLRLFPLLLYTLFGVLIAGSVGLCGTALLANVLTMRIFDRRPLADIGLRLNSASGRNFVIGLLFGGVAAALMLCAPLIAGTGHLVPKESSTFSWGSLVFYLVLLWVAAAGEEMIFRGYGFQLLVEKIGPFATILPVSRRVRICSCVEPVGFRAGNRQHDPLGRAAWICISSQSRSLATDRSALWLECCIAAVRSQSERAYNRCNEVLLSMGSLASLERGSVRTRRGPAGYDLHHRPVLCASQSARQGTIRRDRSRSQRYISTLSLICALLGGLCTTARADKLSFDERMEIERGLSAEFATAKVVLPRSKKPLPIESDGRYDASAWTRALQEQGPAARLGDEVQITRVLIEDSKIVLEINGGTKGGGHWYDHVQVGMNGNTQPVSKNQNTAANGTNLELLFKGGVPSLKSADIRQMLSGVLDFEKHSRIAAIRRYASGAHQESDQRAARRYWDES